MDARPLLFAMSFDFAVFTQLAFQYGPFFFSLLYLYSLSRWAWTKYHQALSVPVENPHRSSAVQVGCYVFVASFVVGILLTLAACVWWWRYRPTKFVFAGRIVGLHSYEEVSFPDMYTKHEDRPAMVYQPDQLHNQRFMLVQDKPFRNGQIFEVDFGKKGNDDISRLEIAYQDEEDDSSYVVHFDPKTKTNSLMKDGPTQTGFLNMFQSTAVYAQDSMPVDEGKSNPSRFGSKTTQPDVVLDSLQDGKTSVGVKIRILRSLSNEHVSSDTNYLFNETSSEPLLVTIIDLSRYSDPQVASLAGDFLRTNNVTELVVKAVTSHDANRRRMGEMAFRHLDDRSAMMVIAWLSTETPTEAAVLRDAGNRLQVAGVFSPQGDRYYLAATWNRSNPQSVSCLAHLFNGALLTDRTLRDEEGLMERLDKRIVYWYDKNWTYSMRDGILKCGGIPRYMSLRALNSLSQ